MRYYPFLRSLPLAAGLLLLAGVGSAAAATHTVGFSNNSFSPNALTVNVGDTVVFQNNGGFHTVTGSGDDPFCGEDQVPTSCSRTFNTPGTFPYRCLFHSAPGSPPSGMVGSITVLAATTEKPNVVPFRLNGWTSSVVLSRAPGSNISDPDFADDQDVWLDWAIANISLTAGISQKFFTEVQIDGVSKASWSHDGLAPDTFNKVEDFNLGKIPLGDHTLKLFTDHTFVVDESNEADNTFETTFRIFPSTANQRTVLVANNKFNPSSLVVKKGTTVNFQIIEGTHTATGTGADPFCGNNSIGNSCSVTFQTAGRFPYRCLFHSPSPTSGMIGEVVVVDPITAESSTTVQGLYNAAAGADVNYTDRTVSFPVPSTETFWRLSSTAALRITRINRAGAKIVLGFE